MRIAELEGWVSQTWWPFVESATLASLFVLVVVACVWLAIRRRASAHLGYALFLLPLVPFVLPLRGLLPLQVETAAPIARWLPGGGPATPLESGQVYESGLQVDWSAAATTGISGEPADAPLAGGPRPTAIQIALGRGTRPRDAGTWSWPLVAFLLWSTIAALFAARWATRQYRTQRLVRDARPLRDARATLIVRRTLERAGMLHQVRIAVCPGLHAPAVSGLWRPTLLLPPDIAERLDDDTLAWSVHHELAHLARRDLWVASLQRALEVLWWFHPLVWLTNRVVGELRECACDEAALARVPELPRRSAALALVQLVEAARRTDRIPSPQLNAEFLNPEKNALEKRILRLMDPRRSFQHGLTPAALALLCLTGSAAFASTQLAPIAERGQEPIEVPEVIEDIQEEPVEIIEEVEPDADALARAAVARSLDWLAKAQEKNGRWGTGSPQEPMAGEFNDVGVTAMAIECLLRSEEREHLDAARRGLTWLASVQDAELGLFGEQEAFGFNAGHALATRLWLRVHRGALEGSALDVAQRALDYIYKARNPYSGWRFAYPPIGDNDTFVTSLMLRALAEAKAAGLEVDEQAIEGGVMFLDECTDPATGRTGYETSGGDPARLWGKLEDFPIQYSEYPTAMALLARWDVSLIPQDIDWLIDGGAILARKPPRWGPVAGSIDGYHWMYGTEALRKVGGVGWQRWKHMLIEALVTNQRVDGSWPLMDAWSGKGDYAHMTCVYTRALQEAL